MILIFLLLIAFSQATPPKITGVEYEVKEASLFGNTLSIAEVTVTADQDLYYNQPYSCPAFTCSPISEICPPCDWSVMDTCGTSLVEGCDCNITDNCRGEWLTIHANIPTAIETRENAFNYFRYYHNDSCSGFRLKYDSLGDSGYIQLRNYQNGAYRVWTGLRGQSIFVCPSDSELFSTGTYEIFFTSYYRQTAGTFTIETFTVDTVATDNCAKRDDCIDNGVEVTGTCNADETYSYVYTAPSSGCINVGIQLTPAIFAAGGYLRASWGSIPADDNSWQYVTRTFETSGVSPAFIVASTCTETTLYIRVDCNVDFAGIYFLSVVEQNDLWISKAVANQSIWDATFSLANTASVKLDGTNFYCNTYIMNCDTIFPTHPVYAQPFLPFISDPLMAKIFSWIETKAIKKHASASENIQSSYEQLYPTVKYNQLKYFIALAVTKNGVTTTFHQESDLKAATLSFLGGITNSNFEPLLGSHSLKLKADDATCDYNTFQIVNRIFNETVTALKSNTGVYVTDALDPALDYAALRFSEPVQKCQSKLDSFYDVTSDTKTVSMQYCPYDETDPKYVTDPCCSKALGWIEGCPFQNVKQDVPAYSLKEDAESQLDTCSSPGCVNSFLGDYQSRLNAGSDSCPRPIETVSAYNTKMIALIRDCKEQSFGKGLLGMGPQVCYTDSDCDAGVMCDLRYHKCQVGRAEQDLSFSTCLIDNMSEKDKKVLFEMIPSPVPENPDEVPQWALENIFGTFYCAKNYDIGGWLDVFDTISPVLGSCLNSKWHVTDPSDDFPLDSGFANCAKDYDYVYLADWFFNFDCMNHFVCNWDASCNEMNGPDCCNIGPNNDTVGCMVCHDTLSCDLLEGVDETSCPATQACYPVEPMPEAFGYTYVQTNDPDCAAGCSKYCYQPTCSGPGACSSKDAVSCQNDGSCTLSFLNRCNQTECATAGYCSSNDLLMDVTAGRWGACVFDRDVPQSSEVLTICPKTTYDSFMYMTHWGLQCVDYTITYPADCDSNGGAWVTPITSQAQCENFKACYEPLPDKVYAYFNKYGFSWKNQDMCVDPLATWTNVWTWESARWVQPTIRNASWTPTLFDFTETFDLRVFPAYGVFQSLVDTSLGAEVGTTTTTNALCDFSNVQTALQSLTCDCYGGENCFSSDQLVPVLVGQTCVGANETMGGTYFEIQFSFNDDLEAGLCSLVTASQISSSWYRSEDITLSSSFANFKKPVTYEVVNDDNKQVGALLSDGLSVKFGKVLTGRYYLCLDYNPDYVKEADFDLYPIYDVGVISGDSVTVFELPVEDKGDKLCFWVHQKTAEGTYFAIIRLDNWTGSSIKYFDNVTLGLFYALTALFLLCSVYGFIVLVHMIALIIMGQQKFKPNLFVVMFTLFAFNLIRCVYFFLVPSGFSSAVADYVLVVLPTFLYFTSFSQIVLIWFVLTSTDIMKIASRINQMVNKATIAFNIVLYAFFIAIVLIFHFEKNEVAQTCGRKFLSDPDNNVKKATLIAYAVIIAFFSLIISVGFAIFGTKFVKQSQYRAKMLKTSDMNQMWKKMIVTIVGTAAFLIHCAFILIQVSLNKPVVIFNFILIVVSEVLPSLYLYAYQYEFRQSDNKRVARSNSTEATTQVEMSSATSGQSSTTSATSSSTGTYSNTDDTYNED